MTMHDETIRKRVTLFHESKVPVHIRLANDRWRNGMIEKVDDDHFLLNEFRNGPTPIFFIEVDTIDPYMSIAERTKYDQRLMCVKAQIAYCKTHDVACVIPLNGICPTCTHDITENQKSYEWASRHITSCPQCGVHYQGGEEKDGGRRKP